MVLRSSLKMEGSTLTNNSYFVKGTQVCRCDLDGVEEGLAKTSNTIQIQNSAPTQPVVTVTIGYTDASEAEIDGLLAGLTPQVPTLMVTWSLTPIHGRQSMQAPQTGYPEHRLHIGLIDGYEHLR